MRFSPRTWSLLSLLLFVAAILFWLKGNEYEARKKKARPAVAQTNAPGQARLDLFSTRTAAAPLAQLSGSATTRPGDESIDQLHPNRLRNTQRPLSDLMRDDHAILLANALIDTAAGTPVKIPEHLRAKGDPGSYIVQWNGPATAEFRSRLAEAGAQIVSYVPNNAYFVKVSADGARQLEAAPGVQAVLPFEPYYKLQRGLLASAVKQELLPEDAVIRLTLLPGTREGAAQAVQALGAEVLGDEASPFGPQLVVHPPVDGLASLAALPQVQGVEPEARRKPAADLSRIMFGVATNGSGSNYFNLTGSNIWVNVNDTGIDTNHPALSTVPVSVPASPIPMAGSDPDGHGTFVASLIAGSGAQSPTNAPGSETNASFRGMAPSARLLALPLNAGGGGTNKLPELNEKVLDSWLIDTAARTNYLALKRTNSLISNNSWTYGVPDYDSAAARYDAAVRDAIPGMAGSQPMLFVFAAGNSGFGNDEGLGGQVDSIESPATAKNVITVGALEAYRLITNFYVVTNVEFDDFTGITTTNTATNYPFAALTDSSNQVAAFSSRGNVGIGLEGNSGRFKPDVVAPGTMVISARSSGWDFNGIDTNSDFGKVFYEVNTNVAPYRFDSGTTFAAANVSGLLALLQEYFERQAPAGARSALSPALMKALLINGSRSLTELYDLTVRKVSNLQGWGLPSLPNMLTSYSTNDQGSLDLKKWRLRMVDQSAANALATGQSRTWTVTLSTNSLPFPFRVTLAWTDPPGNPTVGVKLVNNLDLVVTNLDTGLVFYGNDFPAESDFTVGVESSSADVSDLVNNVENVFIRNPKELGQHFSVTVKARRVNVNAVPDYLAQTGNTNDVVQDFALVVASDIGSDPSENDADTYLPDLDVFDQFDAPVFAALPRSGLLVLTNGLPLVEQRVGANATLVGTNGITNQWNFYVFTNSAVSNSFVQVEAGTNVAFITFDPPNIGRPRNTDADLDMYVSTDPSITNLNPNALEKAQRSVDQGGSETVVLTNAVLDAVYYVAIKSEDQQGAEFSLIGVSSKGPFQQNGNPIVLRGVPIYTYVPDGTSRKPVAGTMVAIGVSPRKVARAVVDTTVFHEDLGDLVGVLSHNRITAILNNHRISNTLTNVMHFDDSSFFAGRSGTKSDGPGNLNGFSGSKISGAWLLQMIDNSPSHTGRVQSLTITINPMQDKLVHGRFIRATNQPGETLFYPIEVGPGVTNLTFTITNSVKLEVYFRQLQIPETNLFDLMTNAFPPSTKFSFPTTNSAPLSPGTHYVAVENTNSVAAVYDLRVDFGFGNRPGDSFNFTGQSPRPGDAALTNTTIYVPNDKLVASAQVSLHMDYPRISDLAISLVSPQGSHVLLSENRGGAETAFGAVNVVTNGTNISQLVSYTIFSDDTNLAQVPIKFAAPLLVQNRTNIGIISSNSFESATVGTAFPGDVVEAPWNADGFLEVVGTGGFSGSKLIELNGGGDGNESGMSASVPTTANLTYRVSFASRLPGRDYLYWTERVGLPASLGTNYLRRMQVGTTTVENLLTNIAIGAFGGVSADVLAGRLYSGDRQYLFRTDLGGKSRTNLVATQNAVTDVEVDPSNNWIYWAESGLFTRTNSIKRARPDGKGVQVLLQLLAGHINGIALDAARNTLYYTLSLDIGRDTVQAIDLGTLQRRVIATLPNATVDPFDVDFDSVSQTLVFNEVGNRSFWRMSRTGAGLTRIFTNTTSIVNGFALDSALQRIVFNSPDTIYSRQQSGTNQTALVQNRATVMYEEIAHGVQSDSGSSTPLVAYMIYNGITNTLVGTADWTSNAVYFIGAGGTQPLTFQSFQGPIWLDNIVVERVPDTFVQPEEPLQTIIGERALGEWSLEVIDTRTGAFLPPGTFDWKLDMNFSDPLVFAETLTGGSRFTPATVSTLNSTTRMRPGILTSNDVHYFIIQPCAGAQKLSVILAGLGNFAGIDFLADTSGIPTGNPDTDDFVPLLNDQNPSSTSGVLEFRLTDKLPAPAHLTPKPIFVALRNHFQDVTNVYSLFVTSDGNCTPVGQRASPLNASQTQISALASSSSDYAANQMGLYSLNVPLGAQAIQINVEADADVSIIARKDEPPTTDNYSYLQNIPGSGSEQLTITANSVVPLTPGAWYVRVVNNTDNPISYSITATGDITNDLEVLTVQAEGVDGVLRLSWNAADGAAYQVQSSSDLATWTAVADLSEGISTYTLPDTSGQAVFYRVVQQ